MSLSQPTVTNPAERFIEWKKGAFQWYDKETKKEIKLNLPARFIVLEQTNTIVGYNKNEEKGIYANEVKSLSNEPLHAKIFTKGTIAKGLWEDIKDKVKVSGGRFCKVVYAALNEGGELRMVAFKFYGAALGVWFEFSNNIDLRKNGVEIENKTIDMESGSTKYKIPVLKAIPVTDETLNKAIEMDKELQKYRREYEEAVRQREDTDAVKREVQDNGVKFDQSLSNTEQEADDLPF